MPPAPKTEHVEAAAQPGRSCMPSLRQQQLPSGPFTPEAAIQAARKAHATAAVHISQSKLHAWCGVSENLIPGRLPFHVD